MTMTSGAYTSVEEVIANIKKHEVTITPEKRPSDVLLAPGSGEWQEEKVIDDDGGRIKLYVPGVEAPVIFKVPEDSLERDTLITMRLFLEVNDDELGALFFEFGPAGAQFKPNAKLKIPFDLLLTEQVDTFVITDEYGGEIDGVSYDINYDKRKLIAYIPHFSYYYFARR